MPLDEAFNTTKDVNFKAYKLMATIPTLSEVVRRKVFDGDDKLTSFKEVDTMYSKLADPSTPCSRWNTLMPGVPSSSCVPTTVHMTGRADVGT